MSITREDIEKLSEEERWRLYEMLCESLCISEDAPLDSDTIEELDRRIADFRANPENTYTHEDVAEYVRKRNSQ